MTTPSTLDESRGPGATVVVSASINQEVSDALELLEYAVGSGFKTKDGQTLPDDIVSGIKVFAAKAGVVAAEKDGKQSPSSSGNSVAVTEWAQFEQSYYRLAVLMHPVTAQTLRDTKDSGKWFSLSPALNFSKVLWVFTAFFAAIVVSTDFGLQRFGPVQEGDVDIANTFMQLLQILIPFVYGGLGSCVYLLRSAHTYIHERTFDVRRTSEYFNRIALGTISGGAITLFVNQIATDDGSVIQLSAAALGFLAGYSTDFFFNAIERVIAAILPKVGIESVRRAAPAGKPPLDISSGGLTLKDLIDRFEKAEGSDKALYRSLIEKLRERT